MFLEGSVLDTMNGRITDLEDRDFDGLVSRMGTAESDIDGLKGRVSSLEEWRSSKASAITDITTTASADSVSILGISVPTNSSYTSLVAAHNALKDKVNAILAALRTREIIVA